MKACKIRFDLATAFLVALSLFVAISAFAAVSLDGLVLAPDGAPVPGATVIGVTATGDTVGTASNRTGSFHLRIKHADSAPLRLHVSSVGFSPADLTVDNINPATPLRITLQPELTEVSGITVTSTAPVSSADVTLGANEVATFGHYSLVPSNPVAALQAPQISRIGSNHSSQLRVHGTNPVYLLNGLSIGTDPDHYGVFSVIPAPVVKSLEFHPQGASAKYMLPSTVELTTPTPFESEPTGEVMLSTVDATISGHAGNQRFFVLGALRKSVLDQLVKQFNLKNDRATLPPTNFQDVFLSAGARVTSEWRVMLDQYYVRDFLSYNTAEAVSSANDVDTYQKSHESYTAVRSELFKNAFALRSSVAVKRQLKSYQAVPPGETPSSTLSADLSEDSRTLVVNNDATWYRQSYDLSAGFQYEHDLKRDYHLAQSNWNFLPPFASTDNAFVYQRALNETYADFNEEARSGSVSLYGSALKRFGPWQLEGGLRYDRFTPLANGQRLNYRLEVERTLGDRTTLAAFHGTFTESPLDNILEAYQVLVRAYLDQLEPVTTSLWTVGLVHGPISVSVFHKELEHLAVTTPEFEDAFDKAGTINNDFITMQSTGQARFNGFTVSLKFDNLVNDRLSLETSYAYTHGYKIAGGVTMPYDLTAPHRLIGRAGYTFSPRFKMAAEGQVRSGYPFTPLRVYPASDDSRYYSETYYRSMLTEENSLRFAANAYLNLSATYSWANTDVFLTLSNLTNRANPIINTAGGIVYDTGILPMLGINHRF